MYNKKYSEEQKLNAFIAYASNANKSWGITTLVKMFIKENPHLKFKNYMHISKAVLNANIGTRFKNSVIIPYKYCNGISPSESSTLKEELSKIAHSYYKKKKQQPKKVNKSVSASFTFHFKVGSLVVYKNRYTDTVYIVIHTGNHTVNLRIIYSPNLHSIGTPYYAVDIDKLELFQGTCTITSEHKCTVEQVIKTKVLQ
jgi:hypothetical protein